jgi:hypothetical protein
MGYDVHITRAENWVDSGIQAISVEEWLEYVRSDPEMRLDGRAEARTSDGETAAYENAGLAVWTAYSQDGKEGNHAWFDFRNGCVVVKNPDSEILSKMSRIAAHLRGQVQGDDGEDYGPDGEPIEGEPRSPWWKRLLGR